MYQYAILLAAACGLLLPSARAASVDPKILTSPEDVHHEVLDNGLHVIIKEVHAAPVVAIQGWVRFGSIHEGQRLGSGVAHYIEHMLFKGTPTRGLGEFERQIRGAGGQLNAYTSYDRTVLVATVGSQYFEEALAGIGDVLANSSLDAEEARKEQEVIVKEQERYRDDPNRMFHYLTSGTVYEQHPRKHPIGGHMELFQQLTPEALQRFYKTFYVPNNAALVIVGDVQTARIMPLVREHFGSWERGVQPTPQVPADTWPSGIKRAAAEHPKANTVRLRVAWPTVTLHDAAMYPLDTLARIFGSGRTSRLYQRLVVQERLAASVSCWNYTPSDHWGTFSITADLFRAEDHDRVLEIIDEEIARARNDGVTPEEVQRAIKNVEAELVFGASTVDGIARSLGSGWLVGDLDFDRNYLARIKRVKADGVRAAAREWLKDEPRIITTLYPQGQRPAADDKAVAAREKLNIHQKRLDNGLKIVVKRNAGLPEVQLRLAFMAGTRLEPAEKAGVSDFLATLLDKGTKSRSADEIFTAIEDVGGSVGAQGGRHTIILQARVLAEDLPLALELVSDMARNPRLDPQWIDRVRQQTLQRIARRSENAWAVNWDNLRELLYGNHPYSRIPAGRPETVESITREDLSAFHQKVIAPDNAVLAIAGDVDVERVEELVNKHLGQWKHTAELPAAPEVDVPANPEKRVQYREGMHLAQLAVGVPGPTLGEEDAPAFEVIKAVLGGMGSRLFLDMRDKRSLGYSVGCFTYPGLDEGAFVFYIASSPHKTGDLSTYHAVLKMSRERFFHHMERLRTEPISDEELAFAKRNLAGTQQIDLQSNGSQAMSMALDTLYGLGPQHSFQQAEQIERVTREDVLRVARKHFRPDQACVAILRPPVQEGEPPVWTEDEGSSRADAGEAIYGVGMVDGVRNAALARLTADARARKAVAHALRLRVERTIGKYMRLVAPDQARERLVEGDGNGEGPVRTIIDEVLVGCRIMDRHVDRSTKTPTYYSLARLKRDSVTARLREALDGITTQLGLSPDAQNVRRALEQSLSEDGWSPAEQRLP